TRLGVVWLTRAALVLVLAVACRLLFRGNDVGRGCWSWGVGLASAALLVLTASLTSHAAGSSGSIGSLVLVDWLHGLATAVWLGGIVGLIASFDLLPSSADRRAFLWRYVRVGLVTIGVLVLTGLVLARSETLSWDGLLSTDYGMWLL